MQKNRFQAKWHRESYEQLLQEDLPQLLSERLPLVGYETTTTEPDTCRITVTIQGKDATISTLYSDIPYPNEEGIFHINGILRTVVPWVEHSDLDCADVKCVGALLLDWIEARLGEATVDLPWDESMLRAWLPLDQWINDFMENHRLAQVLDATNWSARQCHVRRIFIDQPTKLITPCQFGRVDPFEMPEGPNLGRIFTVALGATIRKGAIVVVDESPAAMLGSTSVMIPCLEHDDPNRLLMGANMMRQWLPYTEPEPALVQTGNEPHMPDFWCGRNLLTAYMPWGEDTFEDGIVLSESAAKRLSNLHHTEIRQSDGTLLDLYHEVEPGDKLSNRHGTKGVVCRILADSQMPTLADGTPIELVVSSLRLTRRMNIGQLREALLGRLARYEGSPVIAPPFAGPNEADIRQRLVAAQLPADGLEQLSSGVTPTLVGWVYWGRTVHLARHKLAFTVNDPQQGQRFGALEVDALRKIGATALLQEHFLTRATAIAAGNEGSRSIVVGEAEMGTPPTPNFVQLQQRLATVGIDIQFTEGTVRFSERPVSDPSIQLAQPVAHPWLAGATLAAIGTTSEGNEQVLEALTHANDKLTQLLRGQAPNTIVNQAKRQLQEGVERYLNGLVSPADLQLNGRGIYTGRAVLASGPGLAHDRIGLPDEIAWAFWGPQVAADVGEAAVANRSDVAAELLDEYMADAWVILHHPPTAGPTALLAFRPLRLEDEPVVRLPSLACPLLDADFDGDQIAIHLPITAAGQEDAQEKLSIAGHLRRDPTLLELLTRQDEAIWGLAYHSLTDAGRNDIARQLGDNGPMPDGFLTRRTLCRALHTLLSERGADETLSILRNLLLFGFALSSTTGFSLSPFAAVDAIDTGAPVDGDAAAVQQNLVQMGERLLAGSDYTQGIGPYLLAIKSGALREMNLRTLLYCLGASRVADDVYGVPTSIHHGFVGGLTVADFQTLIPGARTGMARIWQQWEALEHASDDGHSLRDFGVLARARRSNFPGVVFAQAAASHEVDPLTDEESRLFVGVSPSL